MQDLIVSGDIRFLNAYPAVDGLRALPTPITWRRYKDPRWNDADREADGHDAVLMLAGMDDPDEGTRQLQPMDHHFFASISGRQRPAAAQMRQTIHQQRNRARGASVKGETNIFAYEALEEGQSFIGALAAPADRPDLVSSLQTLLSQPLWLGRSGRASYGGAPIFKIGAPGEAEPGTNHKRIQTGDFFAVRLTSDAILRDAVTGQHDPWSLRAAIEKRFGERAIVTQVFIRSTVCTGYHRLWRSSLPAVRAAAAGSVVLMEACENLSTWDLSTLTANPIGERVADGYGCFTVASDSLNGLSIERSRAEISETGAPSEPESEAMLDAQRRLSDKRLRVFLAYEAIQTAANARGLQGSSVIQRVRGPLRAPATWRRTYADWTSGPAEHQLKPMAREGLMSISMEIRFLHHGKLYRERLRLWDVLRRAVDTEWTPTYEFDEAERQACQITSDNVSKQIWTEARAALAPYYLDVLFRSLARRAQSEGEK
ncbi:hypothetical protein CCAX7_35740 [Capsulimonas corticalis]|uniref:Uncharacterized protein n=2 Tax=Capsulimonas corticalis TaxID=2219043 RepID=A0A9N7L639_9BACT|nr:hypothetical protein CCAX7_35740 [Capsulimonas corticalis]